MPELTSPAASSIALPVKAAPPPANAPNPSNQGFCEVMNDKQFKPKLKPVTDEGEGQDDAATGKDLPEKDKSVDPALAWLFGAPAIVLPAPTPAPAPVGGSALVATDLAADIASDVPPAIVAPEVKPAPVEPQGICEVDIAKPRMFTLPVTTPTDQPVVTPGDQPNIKPTAQPDAAPQPVNVPQAIKLPLLQPRVPTNGANDATPAAAVLPALFALAKGTDRTDREDKPLTSLTSAMTPLSQPAATVPVAPMADAQRQMLDMGRQDWPQKMIDHIEALRDNANANDTSIRLKPEALGRVDIALKTHTDGAISVRFTAEQPTTRTLLADATPQLSAVAEARGIRLSGTSVDLSGQGDQRSQPQTERARPTTNRLADTRADDNQAAADGRIA